MSIIKTISILLMVCSVIVALALAQNVKDIINNKKPNIEITKGSDTVATTGLTEITPVPYKTHYTTDGTLNMQLETQNTVIIQDIILTDPSEEEDCLNLINNSGKRLTRIKPLSLSARCQSITAGDPYKISINITYTPAGSDETISEIGTIKGTTEELIEIK